MYKIRRTRQQALLLATAAILLAVASAKLRADTGMCGGASITIPFTDVASSNIFFCSIAAAYFSGLANGTSATTYAPSQAVPREQMAAFVSRTLDQSLKRGSQQAILNQWWTPTDFGSSAKSPVGTAPFFVACDGADLWVTNFGSGTVSRVRASDGSVQQTWVGMDAPVGVVAAQGAVHVTGNTSPGKLYTLIAATAGGTPVATLVTDQLGASPIGVAFDGAAIWTANQGGSVSKVLPGAVTTVSTGFSAPWDIIYDGANNWVTDTGDHRLKKLDSTANILATVDVGDGPLHPVFDGTNIWVPNRISSTVTVVRVKDSSGNPLASPFVLATLSGNGLDGPYAAAFDGQRILVASFGNKVSLWKATDLTPLGSVGTGTNTHPAGACSDGTNFWVTLFDFGQLLRF